MTQEGFLLFVSSLAWLYVKRFLKNTPNRQKQNGRGSPGGGVHHSKGGYEETNLKRLVLSFLVKGVTNFRKKEQLTVIPRTQ